MKERKFTFLSNVLVDVASLDLKVPTAQEERLPTSEETSSNNNEQLPCKGKEIMTEAYSDGKKGDLNNSLLKTDDSTKQDDVLISGFGKNSFAEEKTMKRAKSAKAQSALKHLLAK